MDVNSCNASGVRRYRPAGLHRRRSAGGIATSAAGPNGKVDARGDRRPALTSLLGNDSSRAETERRQFGTAGWGGASAGEPAREAVSLDDAVPAAGGAGAVTT
jgi:hypothetical protein